MKNFSRNKGFTLIELMVVVTILAILVGIVAPRILDNPDKARVAAAKTDIANLEQALQLYKLDNFSYPSTDQGLEALVTKAAGSPEPKNFKSGGYMPRLPKDPWGNPYLFLSPGEQGEIDVFSYGADGEPGGEAASADIGNWNQ
ncbi:type II secretion system major pseudopilin GspG [Pelagibaculum spongiae]|uniref:Type II secretion system core protein G n=1 Tax=Pelagibaculum spongiae TaxID=2080658 RepID=A0A2V1GRA2_9GAMM|nr:type II secretion system major pseudopilin GspG [Pelagibaculum spongiae]PVZ67608.1 type II secretion system protein GspG [Pelagibaculum spongiae]